MFLQLKGIVGGFNADYYGISGTEEARAYLAHQLLGKRLRESTEAILAHGGKAIKEIIPSKDTLKFRSSMTLFDFVSPNDIFAKALNKYYEGERDEKTLKMLSK